MTSAAQLLAKTGEAAKAGPIGLVVILLLCVACYFLFKSMSRHLRKVRDDFPSDSAAESTAEAKPVPDGPTDSDVAGGEGSDAGRERGA